MADDAVDCLLAPLRSRGGSAYLGEPVTQRAHALQAAALAADAAAAPELVVAALLHDLGWLLGAADADHAARGAAHIQRWLGPAAYEPVRMHVEAKRWLCTTSSRYHDRLSAASTRTLELQGGTMRPDELAAFESDPWAADAVRLRRWDDEAKVPGRAVPDLEHWRPLAASLALAR